MHGELPRLKRTVPTDSLDLMKSGCEVIAKAEALVKEVGMVQKTATDEQLAKRVTEDQLAKLKNSVSTSKMLTAKLAESD